MKKPFHIHVWVESKCACGKLQCLAQSYSDKARKAGGRCQSARSYEDGACGMHHNKQINKQVRWYFHDTPEVKVSE